MRLELKAARLKRGWSQFELGQRIGLPQMHISSIETGKVIPRFNTLLDIARILDYDFLMVPRSLVPTVQSLIHDNETGGTQERSLYATFEEPEEEEPPHHEI